MGGRAAGASPISSSLHITRSSLEQQQQQAQTLTRDGSNEMMSEGRRKRKKTTATNMPLRKLSRVCAGAKMSRGGLGGEAARHAAQPSTAHSTTYSTSTQLSTPHTNGAPGRAAAGGGSASLGRGCPGW